MSSRMQRYYDNAEVNTNKRSEKNKELYKRMYEDEIYTNIEGIVSTPKSNEINIEKIRDLVLEREERENQKNHLVKKDFEVNFKNMETLEDDNKSYDIMDILKQAKEEKDFSRENKYRRLDDEYLENLKNPVKKIEKVSSELDEDIKEIKNLLNTLTNSKELSKLRDTDLSLDILSDFKETSTIDDPIIKAIINETKQMEEQNKQEKEENEMDRTFDTTSMKLKANDYVEKLEDLDNEEKTKTPLKVLMVLLFTMLFAFGGFLIYILIK